jgi:hypothetical protein
MPARERWQVRVAKARRLPDGARRLPDRLVEAPFPDGGSMRRLSTVGNDASARKEQPSQHERPGRHGPGAHPPPAQSGAIAELVRLQRLAGNRAVCSLMESGSSPSVRQRLQSPPLVGGHARHSVPVQTMPLNRFHRVLREQQVTAWQDFIRYFQIEYTKEEARGAFLEGGVEYGWDWRRYVQDDAFTEKALIDFYIRPFQDLHRGSSARNRPRVLQDPNRVGLEIEITSVALSPLPNERSLALKNGMLLARTATMALGLPVVKLEVEGMDRGSPCIELIYGPLPRAEYTNPSHLAARANLFESLRQKGPLSDRVEAYNASLRPRERGYSLTIQETGGKLQVGRAGQVKTNTQTNISLPYSRLGATRTGGSSTALLESGDFTALFENPRGADVKMFAKARALANDVKEFHKDPNVVSLLTHVMYLEAKYLYHRIRRGEESKEDKHHFHVMLKMSPQDAIMAILADDETARLTVWLRENADVLAKGVQATFAAASPPFRAEVDAQELRAALLPALTARLMAGRQLLEATDHDQGRSRVHGRQGAVGEIGHTHPRSTNRVPITVSGNDYYVVVEQRSANHPLNDPDRDPGVKEKWIRALQS